MDDCVGGGGSNNKGGPPREVAKGGGGTRAVAPLQRDGGVGSPGMESGSKNPGD